ncbi:MAG: hypothetical protein J3K34DRAFT_480220 [Monoraphidium minutum]|nr:MAG: hypothetical protein J3K34DRAFT_480220 [Monoraphidium minutum]
MCELMLMMASAVPAGDDGDGAAPAAAAAAALPPAAAAPAPARPPPTVVRVSKTSDAQRLAQFLVSELNERPDDRLLLVAAGAGAAHAAARALALARNLLLMTRRVGLSFQPQLGTSDVAPPRGAPPGGAGGAAAAAGGERDAPAGAGAPPRMRVKAGTNADALARAIAGQAEAAGGVAVSFVGPQAALVALRGVSNARRALALRCGKDLAVAAELSRVEAEPRPAGGEGEGVGGGEGGGGEERQGQRSMEVTTLSITLCDAPPSAIEALRRAERRRAERRDSLGAGGGAGGDRRGAGGRGPRGAAARDGGEGEGAGAGAGAETVSVSKTEWEGVRQQLDDMARQTEQLLALLAAQQGPLRVPAPQQAQHGEQGAEQ